MKLFSILAAVAIFAAATAEAGSLVVIQKRPLVVSVVGKRPVVRLVPKIATVALPAARRIEKTQTIAD